MKTTESMGEKGRAQELAEAVLDLRRHKVRDRRAEVERLIEALASDTDAALLARIDEAMERKSDLFRAVGLGGGECNLLWAGSHVDVLRYVAIKRGLWEAPDGNERTFYEWMDREFSYTGGLH
jgi:hypothetical protein